MTKKRSQTENIAIKKKQEDIKLLHNVNNTTGNRSKVTERKPSSLKSSHLPIQKVKVEQDADVKTLLEISPKPSKAPKGQCVSQEQIKQRIRYVVNDKMSMSKAVRKENIFYNKARHYYNTYKSDPEKKKSPSATTAAHEQ